MAEYHLSKFDYKKTEQEWATLNKKAEYEMQLAQGFAVAETFLTQSFLDTFSEAEITDLAHSLTDISLLRFFKINKIVFDPSELTKDKLISVYSALYHISSTVGIIIHGNGKEVSFYYATRCIEGKEALAGELLSKTLKANFPGTDYQELEGSSIRKIIEQEQRMNGSLACVSLIPSARDDDKEKFVQGIEKLINGMIGKKYYAILLASPLPYNILDKRKHGYEELFSVISPYSKTTISYAHTESLSVNEGITSNFTDTVNDSVSNTTGRTDSDSVGSNRGYNLNSSYSGEGWGISSGTSNGSFSSYTTGTSFSEAVSKSTGRSTSVGVNKNNGQSYSTSDTITLNYENKSVQSLMKKAEMQLERIEKGKAFGAWETACYFFSDDISTTVMAANMCRALFTGNASEVENAHINIWGSSKKEQIVKILNNICFLVHPVAEIPNYNDFSKQYVTPTNVVTGEELPILLGLPSKSINGLSVVEMAEFGRNVVYEDIPKNTIEFGSIYHMGVIDGVDSSNKSDKGIRVPINMDLLSSHCFITGSSGSGKSYATYQLLNQLLSHGINMLVIEPAKGEYKQVFGKYPGIRVYTTDPTVYRMLHINPFKFPDNIHILSHIEKLIQIFNASWSLYAAMPAILKDAVVQAYVKCGWDTDNSIWIEGVSESKFPTFKDVMAILPDIINKSDYSSDSKGDYKGALLTRVKSMTDGINGMIFSKEIGVSDSMLFDSNAIIDLSDIGSEETIALLMGVIIMKLGEFRQSVRKSQLEDKRDAPLHHVTVLEEAHNLLKRTSKEQSQEGANIVGKSVEMISNSIKEMRTYGEGFIIIDQSPLAVDSSAIENTSTKLIMNTPAKEACEELGSALALNNEQSKELSRLTTGVAAVFQKGWLVPVLMKIDKWDNRFEALTQKNKLTEMKKVRSEIILELYHQSKLFKYSAIKIKALIKASDLQREKKDELSELITLFNDELNKNQGVLSEGQLGKLFIEFSSCAKLFEVINCTTIPTQCQIANLLNEDGAMPRHIFDLIVHEGRIWLNKIKKSLEYYVTIQEKEPILYMIQCILNYLSNQGENEESTQSILYLFIKEGYI